MALYVHAIKIRRHGLSRQQILFGPIGSFTFYVSPHTQGIKSHTCAPETLPNAQPHSLYTIQSHTYSIKTTSYYDDHRDESSSHNICKFTRTSTATNTATSTTAAVTQSHHCDEYNNCSTAWGCTDQYSNEQASCNWTTATTTTAQWPITATTTTEE